MQNEDVIREIATRACREALGEKSQDLVEDVARRMGVALTSQLMHRERTKELRDGAVLIAGSRTQTEALERLLTASSMIAPACGLSILRGAQAIGWSCHGLTTLDNFKGAAMDCSGGVAARVIGSCAGVATQGSEIDPAFLARLGLENSASILLVPVLLKERVAALLIALPQQSDDLAGLELLVQVAQLTLDMQAYRKAAPRPVGEQLHHAGPNRSPVEPPRPAPGPPRPAPGTQGKETSYAATAAISMRTTAPSMQQERFHTTSLTTGAVIAQPPVAAQITIPALPESVTLPQSFAPVIDEAHEKARRFAKLLVEEIKLYNQTKVAEGRARGDLYGRLREDIEKSRAAYHKRYGARDVDYFTEELIRILADNNRMVMGAGFPS